MEPGDDDVGQRLVRAGAVDQAVVDRVAIAALNTRRRRRRPAWRVVSVAMLATALAAVIGVGVWRTRSPTVVDRSRLVIDDDLISLRAADGTTWILSTTPAETSVPPGTVVVIAGEESR